MANLLGYKIDEWFPTSPVAGPPLPKWMAIPWPWQKVEEAPPGMTLKCYICGAWFATIPELRAHIAKAHPGEV